MKYCNVENGCMMCDLEMCNKQYYDPKYKTVKEAVESKEKKE